MSVVLHLICHTVAICILGAKQACGRLANQKMFHVDSMLSRAKKLEDQFVSLQGSIVVMLIGAIIAGATDLTYSLPGYIWVSVCAISTAMYLLLIRALKDSTGELPYALCCCHSLSLQTAVHYTLSDLLVFWPATTSDLHQSLHSRVCAA